MATKQIIKPAKSPAPVGPYNHAVRVGDLLFCSGQIGIDPTTGSMNLVTGGIEAQTVRVFENIKAILESESLNFGHIIKTTVFMTNLNEFPKFNEIYAKFFTGDFPARSTVQVA